MSKEKNNWRYEEHFHRIPMSDDYDGHYEVTNGDISLCTNDDPEDITETENTLQRVAKALNESGCKFYVNTAAELNLHNENMILRGLLEDILQLETHDDIIEAVTEALKSLKQTNGQDNAGTNKG